MRSVRIRPVLVPLAAGALALLCVLGAARPVARAQPAGTIAVAVSDDAISGPAMIAPGYETVTVNNTGTMPHDLQVFRINDGVTQDQVAAAGAAITDDPATQAAFYALVVPYAGADTLDPGASQTFTENFSAGNYLAADTNGENGPHAFFTVAGTPTAAAAPAADAQFSETEFSYTGPATVPSGTVTFQVTNAGTQNHMMALFRLDPGKTIQDAIDAINNGALNSGPPDWAHPVPGVTELGPGLTVYTTLSLDPGTYVMMCFDTDPATGQPHVLEGMIGAFTAQ